MHWIVSIAVAIIITFVVTELFDPFNSAVSMIFGLLMGGLAGIAAIAYEEATGKN